MQELPLGARMRVTRRLKTDATALAKATAIDAATEADDPQSIAASMRPATALASVNMVQPQSGTERRVLRGVAVRAAALIARGAHQSFNHFFPTRPYRPVPVSRE